MEYYLEIHVENTFCIQIKNYDGVNMTENVLHGKDFSELILRELINEEHSGNELFDELKVRQS